MSEEASAMATPDLSWMTTLARPDWGPRAEARVTLVLEGQVWSVVTSGTCLVAVRAAASFRPAPAELVRNFVPLIQHPPGPYRLDVPAFKAWLGPVTVTCQCASCGTPHARRWLIEETSRRILRGARLGTVPFNRLLMAAALEHLEAPEARLALDGGRQPIRLWTEDWRVAVMPIVPLGPIPDDAVWPLPPLVDEAPAPA